MVRFARRTLAWFQSLLNERIRTVVRRFSLPLHPDGGFHDTHRT
jgi:hypothetical protein